MIAEDWTRTPKFETGDWLIVETRETLGHMRAPAYLRGKRCEVVKVYGAYRDPERLAYHQPGLPPQVLYKVRFRQRDLWASYDGPNSDHLEADIYENWLQPAP